MDHELTTRAERAVLGAMIASPGIAARLAHLGPDDFGTEQHRVVYQAIMTARPAPSQDESVRREAILRAAEPQVTSELLGSLQRACPVPAHGGTYAWLVIQGWASRHLETLALAAAARSGQVAGEARRLRLAHAPESAPAAEAVRHLGQVAHALRRQAATIAAPQVHPVAIRNPGLSGARERQEEIVLAAVASPHPYRARQIARLLHPEAIGDYYRRAVYAAACEMHQAGRHVDELTLDWQLSQLGLPLRYEPGGPTIGQRLARAATGGDQPIDAARQLQQRFEQARGPRPLPPSPHPVQPGPGSRRRTPLPGGQPPLRLVQPPPGHEPGRPAHGPRPAS